MYKRQVLSGGGQKNYALVVVADPAQDAEISELQQKLLRIKSEIHTMASYSETQGKTDGTSEGSSHNKRTGLALVMGLINAASVVSFYTGNVLGHLGMTALSTLMSSFIGDTGAVSYTHLDVYKRQGRMCAASCPRAAPATA